MTIGNTHLYIVVNAFIVNYHEKRIPIWFYFPSADI